MNARLAKLGLAALGIAVAACSAVAVDELYRPIAQWCLARGLTQMPKPAGDSPMIDEAR